MDCSTLPLIRTLYCWVLSKKVSITIFKVFGMMRPGIEPRSPGPLANTLPTRPMSRYGQRKARKKKTRLTTKNNLRREKKIEGRGKAEEIERKRKPSKRERKIKKEIKGRKTKEKGELKRKNKDQKINLPWKHTQKKKKWMVEKINTKRKNEWEKMSSIQKKEILKEIYF